MSDRAASPVSFDEDGVPRSRRYGDVYFSREGGLAESREVFLAGCGLPERWHGRRRFIVAELGFGTGLNIAALLELWRTTRPAGGRLSMFSVEAEPLSREDAERALGAWPELAAVAAPMLARWPGRRSGFHRLDLPEFGATLDLAVMDAEAALAAWDGHADAWFLDGFAPSVNPQMWTDALMAQVARRSAPGACAATYTVAGQARRALAVAGFTVERKPGFGGKRERLEARLPGPAPQTRPTPRVAIVGAGIAGAALAHAFTAEGAQPHVFDAVRLGAGASGNPSALVTPRLDAGLGPSAQLHAQAFARAVSLYDDVPGAVIARGVLQLEAGPRDAARFARIAACDLFEPGTLTQTDAGAVSGALAEPAPAALRFELAPVIEPATVLAAWSTKVTRAGIAVLERLGDTWRLADDAGGSLGAFDIVCLATGAELPRLWPEAPIQPVRGQLTFCAGISTPAAAWGAYLAPTRGGVAFGATHDRGDAGSDTRAGDDARNLAALAERFPALAARIGREPLDGRAAIRAVTPDRLPLAGPMAQGLYVLGGLGARGFTLAPLLAEHLVAVALGLASPLPATLAAVVDPERFARRAARRGMAPATPSV